MSISKIIENGMQGATLGGIIGEAVATALGVTALCLTGPVGFSSGNCNNSESVSGTAIGTAINGTGSAVLGTIEEAKKK